MLVLQGCSFDEVCEMTTIFEGSIIRAVRRLEELLNQLSSAAQVLLQAQSRCARCHPPACLPACMCHLYLGPCHCLH